MALNERQQEILEQVQKKQRRSVTQLAKSLYVSEMTVRRDLTKMEREGYLRRYHGGAMANDDYLHYPISMRMHVNEKEKRDLAKRAQAYLRDGLTIFLPGSSTCAFLLPCLNRYKDLCVITNSVQFMITLSKMEIRCQLTGGEYRQTDHILIGRLAESTLRDLNPAIAFLACDGIAEDGAVTVEDENTAALVRIGFANAEKRIILADRSKLHRRYTHTVCHTDQADEILVI